MDTAEGVTKDVICEVFCGWGPVEIHDATLK
jgi:hypothetical protein